MIHLEGSLLAQHHRPGTGTPLRSRLTQGGSGLLQRRMPFAKLGLLCLIGKNQPPPMDKEREKQSQRFDRGAPLSFERLWLGHGFC